MKVTTFCKVGVSLGAAALLIGGVALPAMADPVSGSFGTLVGVGSDTTQDVVNGIATSVGGNLIASYDANAGSSTIITRAGGTPVPRVSGSGAGRDTLLVAMGALANKSGVATSDGTPVTIDSSVVGQVDFARSSGGPGSATLADGVVAYVPFARDAVDVAYAQGSALSVVPFFKGDGTEAKTAPSLYNIYRGDVAYVYINTDGSYNSAGKTAAAAPANTTAYKLQPILPKFGSGTRSYFLTQLGLTDASGFTTTNPFVKDVSAGDPIEEHDGTAIAAETTATTLAVGPFSVSQWVAQGNAVTGVKDRRHHVLLADLGTSAANRVSATSGTAGSYATNSSYAAMVRDVYNIVPSRLLDDPTSLISKTFSGANSTVCQQAAVIAKYGFLPEPATSASTTCGFPGLRAYAASTSTTTLSVPATGTAGSTVKATATVDSFGVGGGTVNFLIGGTVASTATIASGATSVTADVPVSGTGAQQVTAQFVPALTGVGSSVSDPATVTVSAAATASKTTITVPAQTFGTPTTVTAWISGYDPKGGTVKLLVSGKYTVATVAMSGNSGKALLTFTPNSTAYSLSAVYTPKTSSVIGSTSASTAVKVAPGTPKFAVSAIPTVKSTVGAKFTVAVAGTVVPTGTITVKEGTKTLVSGVALSAGKAGITLPKLAVGKHYLTVTYNGSAAWKATSKTATVTVTK